MNKFLKRLKGAVKNITADKAVAIPITSDRLLRMFRKGMQEQEADIRNLDVHFHGEKICMSGLIKKLFMQIYFEIEIQPLKAEHRALYFTIPYMKPLNHEWVKEKIFNKSPYIVYKDKMLKIDLNEIDAIKSVPVGSIKHFCIENGKIWIKIGV